MNHNSSIELNKIYNEDNLNTMSKMPDNFIDIIITSPPYEDFGGAGYAGQQKDILFLKFYSDYINKLFTEYYRVLKPTGQIYFNIKSKTFNKKLNTVHWLEFTDGFKLFKLKSYIIWKYAGSFDSTNKRFHLDYEIIYHLSKTDDIYLNVNCGIDDPLSSVWYVPHNISKKEGRIHPTQMPLALAERILKVCGKKEYLVYDSFMGSGTTAIACINFSCNFIGSELNELHFKNSLKRIKEHQNQLRIL